MDSGFFRAMFAGHSSRSYITMSSFNFKKRFCCHVEFTQQTCHPAHLGVHTHPSKNISIKTLFSEKMAVIISFQSKEYGLFYTQMDPGCR